MTNKEIIERNKEDIKVCYADIVELENKIENKRRQIREMEKQNTTLMQESNTYFLGLDGTKEEGIIVYAEVAFEYACERCGLQYLENGDKEDMEQFKKTLVDWFYSGNFVKVEGV